MLRRLLPRTLHVSTQSRAFSRLPFRVHRGAIAAPSDPIHENQRVECTWTIRSGNDGYPHHRKEWHVRSPRVEKLKILTPGLTLINVRPDLLENVGEDVVARVKVSSSTAETLQSVQVSTLWPDRTLLQFRPPRADQQLVGHLVTEIDLPYANALRSLAAIGLGDVVVGESVLFTGGEDERRWVDELRRLRGRRRSCQRSRDYQTLKLMAGNETSIFVHNSDSEVCLDSLKIGSMGTRSQVAMDVSALDLRGSLDLLTIGGERGGISLQTDSLIASRLRLAAVGSGSIDLLTRQKLDVPDVRTFAVGEGSVTLDSPDVRSAANQKVTTLGSPYIDTAALSTHRANVRSLGSADVRLHVRDRLRVRSVGSGVVECVDRIPGQVDVRGLPWPTLVESPRERTSESEPVQKSGDVQTPTIEDAFDKETTLHTPRMSFLSRIFGRDEGAYWDEISEEKTEPSRSPRNRTRRRTRW